MGIDNIKVGRQIAQLRTSKGITQGELGDRVGVSFQAVSKWERGETLPDISILPNLADILETTIDNILLGGTEHIIFRGKVKVQDLIEGVNCLKKMGELLGNNNILYRSAVDGINTAMNTEIEPAFSDDNMFEAFVAEAVIQNIQAGMYIDITDINRCFKHEHFRKVVHEYAKKHSIV